MTQPIQPPQNVNINISNLPSSYHPSRGQSQSVSSFRHDPLAAIHQNNEVTIPIKTECQRDKYNCDNIRVTVQYSDNVTIGRVLKAAIRIQNQRHKPLTFSAVTSYGKTFMIQPNAPHSTKTPITKLNKSELMKDGITIQVVLNKYVHRVDYQPITCPHMIRYHQQTNQWVPESCPIYNSMKNQYVHSKQHLEHLRVCNHFTDQFDDKPPCRYASQCFAFKRLEEQNVPSFEDLCHVQLYRHPPRENNIVLKSNINALAINKDESENHPLYEPTDADKAKYQYDEENGFLNALIDEVKRNGYEDCFQFDDENDEKQALLSVVDEKLKCDRHKKMSKPLNRAQMLSLILYTGAVINHKMCKKQRMGDYDTWKWFDYCLWHAIRLLSINETGEFKVYAGLKKVSLDKKYVDHAYFKTYQSSAWKLKVAMAFLKEIKGGMLIVMDSAFRKNVYCCDVSWISKFKDECEVLFARSVGSENKFSLKVMEKGENRLLPQFVSLYFKAQ